MYLFSTYYVPIGLRHKISILILYLTDNLEIFNVPFLCLFRLCHFSLCLSCAHKNLEFFQCAYCVPNLDFVMF